MCWPGKICLYLVQASGLGLASLLLDFGEVVFRVKPTNVANSWALESKHRNATLCLAVKILCKSSFLALRCPECDPFANKATKDNIDECVNTVLMSTYRKEKVLNVKCPIDVQCNFKKQLMCHKQKQKATRNLETIILSIVGVCVMSSQ